MMISFRAQKKGRMGMVLRGTSGTVSPQQLVCALVREGTAPLGVIEIVECVCGRVLVLRRVQSAPAIEVGMH